MILLAKCAFRSRPVAAVTLFLSIAIFASQFSLQTSQFKITKNTIDTLNSGLRVLVNIKKIIATLRSVNELTGNAIPAALAQSAATRPRLKLISRLLGVAGIAADGAATNGSKNQLSTSASSSSSSILSKRNPSLGLIKIGEKPPPGLFPETLPYSLTGSSSSGSSSSTSDSGSASAQSSPSSGSSSSSSPSSSSSSGVDILGSAGGTIDPTITSDIYAKLSNSAFLASPMFPSTAAAAAAAFLSSLPQANSPTPSSSSSSSSSMNHMNRLLVSDRPLSASSAHHLSAAGQASTMMHSMNGPTFISAQHQSNQSPHRLPYGHQLLSSTAHQPEEHIFEGTFVPFQLAS